MKRTWSQTQGSSIDRKTPVEPSAVHVSFTASGISPSIGVSEKIHDRSSTFQGYFFPIRSSDELKNTLSSFRTDPACTDVDHIMTAHKFHDEEIGDEHGFDDDGERFAGKKLLDVLEKMDMYGLIICTRKYGGVMLGPIRFQHIMQCAREAIMVFRRLRSLEDIEITKLQRQLQARDRTIMSLREILKQKQLTDADKEKSENGAEAQPEIEIAPDDMRIRSSGVDRHAYARNSVTLQRLLKARNASITALRLAIKDAHTSQFSSDAQSCES